MYANLLNKVLEEASGIHRWGSLSQEASDLGFEFEVVFAASSSFVLGEFQSLNVGCIL
ncbi:unnamed protein product [Lupinus luteus]|uniref:Uncharacterized protein n=1 Tax=Lupinus luteus TaxID=3873 RepID=A0AAV1WJY9_LUPLU